MTLSPATRKRFALFGADQLLSTELAAKIVSDARKALRRIQSHMARIRREFREKIDIERGDKNQRLESEGTLAQAEVVIVHETISRLQENHPQWSRAETRRRIYRAMQYTGREPMKARA
jgi:hypothetical protein